MPIAQFPVAQQLLAAAVQTPLSADAVQVGRVVGSYGLKGWIKIQPLGDAAGLLATRRWWLQDVRGQCVQLDAVLRKSQGASVVAQCAGLDVPEHAQSLKGQYVWVSRADFPPLPAGEYYWVDLIGCTALAQDASVLGQVVEVMDNSAHAVLRVVANKVANAVANKVENEAANAETKPAAKPAEYLIPFVGAFVGEVDLTKRCIQTQWLAQYSE